MSNYANAAVILLALGFGLWVQSDRLTAEAPMTEQSVKTGK